MLSDNYLLWLKDTKIIHDAKQYLPNWNKKKANFFIVKSTPILSVYR